VAGGLADRFTAPVVMTASASLLSILAATLLLRRRSALQTI
jgi:hypothetical protein